MLAWSVIFVVCVVKFGSAASSLADVRANNGTAFGMICHFPFLYNGTMQNTCVTNNMFNRRSWCSVTSQYTGDSPHNLYGFCDISYRYSVLPQPLQCVLSQHLPTAEYPLAGYDFRVIEGNDSGKRCIFPFIYENRYHFECLPDDTGRGWCSTSPNYDVDKRWGFCGGQPEPRFVSSTGLVRQYYKNSASWKEAQDYCKLQSSRLCGYQEICVGGEPLGGTVEGEHWVPIAQDNTWVNIGDEYGWACLTVDVPSESSISAQYKGYVMCCEIETDGFVNYIMLNKRCMVPEHIDLLHHKVSLQECHDMCENKTSCRSFSYELLDEVCTISQQNSITAKRYFEICGNNTDRYSFYFEKILHREMENECEIPFVWENRIYYECLEINGEDYCAKPGNGNTQELHRCNDCFDSNKPSAYRGRLNRSKSGRKCLNWKRAIFKWEEGEFGLGDHNYCRNPDQDVHGVWCYVGGMERNFDYCDLPRCNEGLSADSNPGSLIPPKCGKMRVPLGFLPKIYGGRFASGHFNPPWQVSLFNTRENTHECGGAIIASCFVVTAAHCFKRSRFSAYVIKAGFKQGLMSEPEQIAEIEDVKVHPLYRFGEQEHDIAIIQLKSYSCLQVTHQMNPICLPQSLNQFRTGFECVASGFGQTEYGQSSHRLKYVWLPLMSKQECSHESVYGDRITEGMQCAGGVHGYGDTCKGDSGGPLACRDPLTQSWYLWGVVSWGEMCGVTNKPGVYTKVRRYIDWIACVTNNNGDCHVIQP